MINVSAIYNNLPRCVIKSKDLEYCSGVLHLSNCFEDTCADAELDEHEEFTCYVNSVLEKGYDSEDMEQLGAIALLSWGLDIEMLSDEGLKDDSEVEFLVGDNCIFKGLFSGLIEKYAQYLQ